jgi:protein-arginine kinase
MNRDWPFGRGVFFNSDFTLVAWVNGEDHLMLTCTEDSTDVKAAFNRLAEVRDRPLYRRVSCFSGPRPHRPLSHILQEH